MKLPVTSKKQELHGVTRNLICDHIVWIARANSPSSNRRQRPPPQLKR